MAARFYDYPMIQSLHMKKTLDKNIHLHYNSYVCCYMFTSPEHVMMH
jgi:hypothetical protein